MNRMLKRAAVALVLAMVAFGPTAALAAPHQNVYASGVSGAKFGLIDVLMQILGIASKAPAQQGTKPVTSGGTTITPTSGGGTVTTDGAIWGGGRGGGGCVPGTGC